MAARVPHVVPADAMQHRCAACKGGGVAGAGHREGGDDDEEGVHQHVEGGNGLREGMVGTRHGVGCNSIGGRPQEEDHAHVCLWLVVVCASVAVEGRMGRKVRAASNTTRT